MKNISKKNLTASLLLVGGFLGIALDYYNVAKDILGNPIFVVSIALVTISIPLFFIKEEIFTSWLKFSSWWIPLTVVIVFLVPLKHGGFLPSTVDKGIYAFFMWSGFVFFSLLLMTWKWFVLREKK